MARLARARQTATICLLIIEQSRHFQTTISFSHIFSASFQQILNLMCAFAPFKQGASVPFFLFLQNMHQIFMF